MIKFGKPLILIRNVETNVAIECLINVLTCYNMTDSNLFINSKQQLIYQSNKFSVLFHNDATKLQVAIHQSVYLIRRSTYTVRGICIISYRFGIIRDI